MTTNNNNHFETTEHKDIHLLTFPHGIDFDPKCQEHRYYKFLLTGWYTNRQVEELSGIRQNNSTMFKVVWQSRGMLWTTKEKQRCPISTRPAFKLTTNRELAMKGRPELFIGIQSELNLESV